MIRKIVKIEKEGSNHILFNQRGMVLELNANEYEILQKYANGREFPKAHKEFFNKMCCYEMTEFDGYFPKKVPVDYSQKLLGHNSENPVFKSPIVAHLGITSMCNMKCKYCSVRKPYHKMKELTTTQWKFIIKKLSDMGVFQIGFTGGEPTLRKDLPELANYVNSLNCTFNLTTNCWNLDENLIIKLKEAGMRQCQVSLDCHIDKVNDHMRKEGSLRKVIASMEMLKRNGIIVGVDCVVTKNNIEYIPEFIEWLGQRNIPYITLIKIKQGDLSIDAFTELLPGYVEYSFLIEKLCNRKNENPCVTLDCGSVSNLEYTLKNEEIKKVPVAGCPAGHTLLSISPNGDIFPCVALGSEKFFVGNALEDDISEIWNKNSTLRELREIKSRVRGKCKECKRLDHCRGGCRGIAYSICNNRWESDNTCLYGETNV